MCNYCGCGMYGYGYPQQYGYGAYGGYGSYGGYAGYGGYGSYPYYGLPAGYGYTFPSPPVVYPAVAPLIPRGEHRVGNCLMICQ